MKRTSFFIFSIIGAFTYTMQPPKLTNFNATCYINSTIQLLYNYTTLTQYLFEQDQVYPQNTLGDLYVKLITGILSLPAANTPDYQTQRQLLWQTQLWSFVTQAYASMGGCGQMDATQFVATLLNSLMVEDIRFQDFQYQNDPTLLKQEHPIGKLLAIGQTSIVNCPLTDLGIEENYESKKTSYEVAITAEAQNFSSLHECLQSYFKTEQLTDPYAMDLSEEQLQTRPELEQWNRSLLPNCTKRIAISHLPDVVIIILKRYAVDPATGIARKLTQNIHIEPTISFGPYMLEPIAKAPTYELIGAIVQAGTLRAGHYIAYVKSNDQWYFCSDTTVEKRTWANMKKPPARWQSYSIDQSYALMYRKQPKAPAPPPVDGGPEEQPAQELRRALGKLTEALDGLFARLL